MLVLLVDSCSILQQSLGGAVNNSSSRSFYKSALLLTSITRKMANMLCNEDLTVSTFSQYKLHSVATAPAKLHNTYPACNRVLFGGSEI